MSRLLDRTVLDALWANGLRVIDSVYPYGGDDATVVTERVRQIEDHPALLYYWLGNEWNCNGLYVGLSAQDALALPAARRSPTRRSREKFLEQAMGSAGGARARGTRFEWADEGWKDDAGSPRTQEMGEIAPGGGPYPDGVFNEEWWGLVDIHRARRPAFDSLPGVFGEYRAR